MKCLTSKTTRSLTLVIGWAISMIFSPPLMAADCTSVDIVVNSQSQVDGFQSTYGPCDRVLGDLTVEGSDINQLDGLSSLVSVVCTLNIKNNPNLQDINGLANLITVGENLFLENNSELNDLDGLVSLTEVGQGLYIFRNDSLDQINGFRSLNTVGGHFYISMNPRLVNLDGLAALERVGNWLRFWRNENLVQVDGFNGLKEIGIGLDVDGNSSLVDINGFALLTDPLPNLFIQRNDSLVEIGGFTRLNSLGSLLIFRNNSLVHLNELDSLESVGSLTVSENPAMISLSGLGSIKEAYSVSLTDNVKLQHCHMLVRLLDPIDDYGPGPGPGASGIPDVTETVTIQNNGEGCNSVAEMLSVELLYAMNAGLNDAWFNLETSGQGFLITVFPEIKQIFMAWFTYDTERPPEDVTAILGEPGHRWLTAQGEYIDNVAELTLYASAGGVFDSEEPPPETLPYGEILLEFTTCNAGTVTYDIPSIFQAGTISIERITLDNVPLCYVLEQQTLSAISTRE